MEEIKKMFLDDRIDGFTVEHASYLSYAPTINFYSVSSTRELEIIISVLPSILPKGGSYQIHGMETTTIGVKFFRTARIKCIPPNPLW